MDSTNQNAVAGPSNPRSSSFRPISPSQQFSLFLPPPAPPKSPAYITSTRDLLGQFHLRDAYDKYVRANAIVSDEPAFGGDGNSALATSTITSIPGGTPSSVDKGKGKEVTHAPQTPAGDGQDGDDDDAPGGKGEKKKKNSYKHLIKGVPGKHSMKKDDYLTTIIQIPPKQRVKISEFDTRTQRDAFTVSLEGLKSWNPSALVLESAQAREDRKKRKELKRLAKAQMQAQAQAPSISASTPIQAPVPTPASLSSFPTSAPTPSSIARPPTTSATPHPSGPGTPRPHPPSTTPLSRPVSVKPGLPPVQIPVPGNQVGTPLRTGTPIVPHPLSAPPLSANSIGTPSAGSHGPPLLPTVAGGGPPRGKKRERDDSGFAVNGNAAYQPNPISINGTGTTINTSGIANSQPSGPSPPPKAIIGARAGSNGVRPRPVKKQKMDSQGVSRDTAPVQQPTPQGV